MKGCWWIEPNSVLHAAGKVSPLSGMWLLGSWLPGGGQGRHLVWMVDPNQHLFLRGFGHPFTVRRFVPWVGVEVGWYLRGELREQACVACRTSIAMESDRNVSNLRVRAGSAATRGVVVVLTCGATTVIHAVRVLISFFQNKPRTSAQNKERTWSEP
jgi:hypothetical protein